MNTDRAFSRRKIVGMFGVAAVGAALAACSSAPPSPTATPAAPTQAPSAPAPTVAPVQATPTPAAAPTAAPTTAPTPTVAPAATAPPAAKTGPATVTFMIWRGELSDKEQAAFEGAHAGLKLNVIDPDIASLMAKTAAGTPPDIYRLQAPELPGYLFRKMVRDLTDSFKTSKLLKIDDLGDANKNYWYGEGFQVGTGKIYGMVKDWSPDLTLFVNKKLFDAAGVAVPGDTEHLSYREVAELARKLTKRQGDRTVVMGYGGAGPTDWFDRVVEVQLNSLGKSLYSDDFSAIKLSTPEARDVLQFWFDLAKANVMYNPLSPPVSWSGEDFTKEQCAIVEYGFWFSGMAESDQTKGNVIMLPSPKWGPVIKDPTITATGAVIHSRTKSFDPAWTVYEWYMGGDPAVARAKSGWGIPALKSLYTYIPKEGAFRSQVWKVVENELKITDVAVRFNPFTNASEDASQNTFLSSWNKNLQAALKGQLTLDAVIKNVEKDVNVVIRENLDKYGA